MNKKIRVGVIMGGKSSEHEVSLLSGSEVIKNLDKNKFSPFPLVISKTGKGIEKIFSTKPDVLFIALHGPFGEDGTVQGMLELTGIPYTCSGVLASAIGMDKLVFRKLMEKEKIKIPEYAFIGKGEEFSNIFKKLNFPLFVKPSDQGSSVGASVARNNDELKKAMLLAFKYSEYALVDEYIKGLELTCTVMGNKKPVALPVIEIRPLKGSFFDYKSKYSDKGSEEIVPARIPASLTKKIQELSVKVYKIVGCKGFARVDFILKNDKEPVVLEINTIPGLTAASLAPKAAKAAGLTFPQFLGKIISYALEKK